MKVEWGWHYPPPSQTSPFWSRRSEGVGEGVKRRQGAGMNGKMETQNILRYWKKKKKGLGSRSVLDAWLQLDDIGRLLID